MSGLSGLGLARLVIQISTVVAAAFLVGLAVFIVVRAVAGPGEGESDAGPDPFAERVTIDPGPSDGDGVPPNSSRSGSRRGETVVDSDGVLRSSSESGESAFSATNLTVADDATPSGTGDPQATAAGSGAQEASTSTVTTTTTIARSASAPTLPTITTARATSTPASTSATAKPTTAKPTTTVATSTTEPRPSTTPAPPPPTRPTTALSTAPPLPPALIGSPAAGGVESWNTATRFRANRVPGATTYCWTMVAVQRADNCGPLRTFDLPGGSLFPGPATVVARAVSGDGKVLMTQQISFDLLATEVLNDPRHGDSFRPDDRMRLRSNDIPGATNYCWILTQGGYNSGEFCDTDGRLNLSSKSDIRRSLEPGPAQVQGRAYRNDTLVGRQSVTVDIQSG